MPTMSSLRLPSRLSPAAVLGGLGLLCPELFAQATGSPPSDPAAVAEQGPLDPGTIPADGTAPDAAGGEAAEPNPGEGNSPNPGIGSPAPAEPRGEGLMPDAALEFEEEGPSGPVASEPDLDDPQADLPEERYALLWQQSAFGVADPPPPTPEAPPPVADPFEDVSLVGVMEENGNPVVLIRRAEGSPVERLDFEQGVAGFDLIDVQPGRLLADTQVMLAGPQGEGWISFASTALPQNQSGAVSTARQAPQQEGRGGENRGGRDDRGGRGQWSEQDRNEARQRVGQEMERTQSLLSRAQDPQERANLEERMGRLQEFQNRINANEGGRGRGEGGGRGEGRGRGRRGRD